MYPQESRSLDKKGNEGKKEEELPLAKMAHYFCSLLLK
jgi:hypothetical protein